MEPNETKDRNWNRIYLYILGYNSLLVIVFYLIRLVFNSN